MNIETLIFEAGVLLLAAAMVYLGIALSRLTEIVKKKEKIWVFPVLAAFVLLVSLVSHAYASYSLLPAMNTKITAMTSQEVLLDKVKLETVKAEAALIRQQLVALKAFSFTCFLLSALMLLASTAVYIRWISR